MDPTGDSEVLSDRDPNHSGGRTSRGSSRSGLSRSSSKPAPPASGKTAPPVPGKTTPPVSSETAPPALSSAFPALFGPGITSMLRTETELGDLGDIVFGNLSGSSSRQYRTQWHGAYGSMSATSSRSNFSGRASKPFLGYSLSSSSAQRYPTIPNGPQHDAGNDLPAMPNFPSSSPPGTIENRDRNLNRSQSTTHTTQSLHSVSANTSHTNLRYAYNLRPHNSYTHLATHRAEPGSSAPTNWLTSSTLSDKPGLPSQDSQTFEGQRPLISGYSQTYANIGPLRNPRGQSNVEQGQPYHGPGQPHNVGQMRFRLPHRPSPQRLEDRHGEMEAFLPLVNTKYDEQLDSLHASKLQPHRNWSPKKYADHRSEAFTSPENHEQDVAVEQAGFKRFAPGPVSSNLTYLRTNSDVLSSDTTASPVSNDGRSIATLRLPGDIEKIEPKDTSSYPSNLCFPVADSMLTATRSESTENMTNRATSDPNRAAGPEQTKEGRVFGVPASFLGDGSNASIDGFCGDDTPSERRGNVSEYAVTPMSSSMKPLPFVTRATSDHAQKSWDEQSSKPCQGIPEGSLAPARPESDKNCKEYSASTPNVLLQQGKYLLDPDTYSCPTAKGAANPDSVDHELPSQYHSPKPVIKAVENTRISSGFHSSRPVVTRKPLPMYLTLDHFPCLCPDSCATCASTSPENSLRNSQTNTSLGRGGRVAPGIGVGPRHGTRRSATSVGSHRNSLASTRLTNIQEDSMQDISADLELSRHRHPGPSRHLPNLEDSYEGANSPPVSGTPWNVQASGEDLDNVSRSSTVSRRCVDIEINTSNAFDQSRGLLPMQPSQADLFDELSGSVGVGHSLSVEQVPRVSQKVSRDCPPRPAAADEVQRERTLLVEVDEVERAALSMQAIASMNLSEMHRACSLEPVAEIEGMAVPSVGEQTQSLSESCLLLKETRNRGESTEYSIKEEIDRTHPTRKHSSTRLGPVPGIPHMVPEDAVYDELEKSEKENVKEKEKDMSGCIDGGVAAIGASGADAVELETGNSTTPTQTRPSRAPPTNPAGASSAVTRGRSNTLHVHDPRYSSLLTLPPSRSLQTQLNSAAAPHSQIAPPAASRGRSSAAHNQDPRCSSDFTLPPRRSSRSRTSTFQAGETQPCNPDTNSALAVSTNTAADTFLPNPAPAGRPPHPRPPHICNRLSEASITTAFSTARTVTASPSHPPADSTARAPADHLNSFVPSNNQPHEPGERYPTSALSPPTAIFRDQLCVSDTDDDDIHDITREARDPLCKRILTACDNAYYKLALRASRVQPSPEWFKPTTQVIHDRACEAQDLAISTEAESHKQRHPKTCWQRSSHRIRQLTFRKPSSKNNG